MICVVCPCPLIFIFPNKIVLWQQLESDCNSWQWFMLLFCFFSILSFYHKTDWRQHALWLLPAVCEYVCKCLSFICLCSGIIFTHRATSVGLASTSSLLRPMWSWLSVSSSVYTPAHASHHMSVLGIHWIPTHTWERYFEVLTSCTVAFFRAGKWY